jgi:acyl-CoA thioesterase-1
MRTRLAAAAASLFLVAGCAGLNPSRPPNAQPAPAPSLAPYVYAALGASETVGIGTSDPARESFPQQLLGLLSRQSVLYNFGLPSETTQKALADEVPQAVAVRPDLATVFFNVDDIAAGVPPADFQARLDQIVAALRAGGHTTVLLANTPRLDDLPAYQNCLRGLPSCPLGSSTLLANQAQLGQLTSAYNFAIAQVAQSRQAIVVDLFRQSAAVAQHPEYVSEDGFHPSRFGAAAIAESFAAAIPKKVTSTPPG